jgi:hypothetical protein
MVLNLMILKVFSFKPGLDWRKNTLPLFAIKRTSVVRIIIGDSIANKKKDDVKSATGFTMSR